MMLEGVKEILTAAAGRCGALCFSDIVTLGDVIAPA